SRPRPFRGDAVQGRPRVISSNWMEAGLWETKQNLLGARVDQTKTNCNSDAGPGERRRTGPAWNLPKQGHTPRGGRARQQGAPATAAGARGPESYGAIRRAGRLGRSIGQWRRIHRSSVRRT